MNPLMTLLMMMKYSGQGENSNKLVKKHNLRASGVSFEDSLLLFHWFMEVWLQFPIRIHAFLTISVAEYDRLKTQEVSQLQVSLVLVLAI